MGDTQQISNLGFSLEFGIDQLVPIREPTEAERYEVHQRWVWQGGFGVPGASCDQNMILKKMKNRPDPIGRSEMESDAYKINSGLTLIFGLFDRLPELVKEI